MGKTFLMTIIVLPLILFSAPSKQRLDDFAANANADGKSGEMQSLMKTVTLTEGGARSIFKVIDADALAEKLGQGGILKLTVPSEVAAAAASSSAAEAERKTETEKQPAGQPGNRVIQTGQTAGIPPGSQGAVGGAPAERKSKLAYLDQKEVKQKPGGAGSGGGYRGTPVSEATARMALEKDEEENQLLKDFKTKHALKQGNAGDYSFQYAVLTDKDITAFIQLKGINYSTLCFILNNENIFLQNDRGYFYEGQEKVVDVGEGNLKRIFGVSKYYAYYWDSKTNTLWIYSQKKGLFSDEFSTFAKITFTDIKDARMTGLALIAFMNFVADEGLSKEQFKQEAMFILNNFGIAYTDENGVIMDSIFHRAQFRLADGRVGVFTVTGQIDPKTNKGYNWATVRGGNTYAGMGGDMVDIKSLLTRAEYRDLALAILNNKSLMVNMIVRVTGSWLLQHGQLNGGEEDIKKFLDYDTSGAPYGYSFDVVDGRVIVKPRQ